jgi:hypothetical protein
MAIAVTGRRVIKSAENTSIVFEFSNGTGLEFPSIAAARAAASELEATPDLARLILIARFLAQQPDANNVTLFEGKTLTLDLNNVSPIRIQ